MFGKVKFLFQGKHTRESLVFSLVGEVPYTYNVNQWEKFDLDDKKDIIKHSFNENSPYPDDPWAI